MPGRELKRIYFAMDFAAAKRRWGEAMCSLNRGHYGLRQTRRIIGGGDTGARLPGDLSSGKSRVGAISSRSWPMHQTNGSPQTAVAALADAIAHPKRA